MRVVVFLLLSVSVFAQSDPWKNVYTESAWKERDAWQRADELIQLLHVRRGSRVADVGSHEGYMTFKLATAVGESGRVFAVDVESAKLDKLKAHATERDVRNVTAVKGDYDDPKLAANSLDAVIILDTYHEMQDHDKILQHIKAALKKGGRLLICEPIANERRGETRARQESKHELEMKFALEDLQKAGLTVTFKQDRYVDREKVKGDTMWVIVATKP